MRVDVVTLFPEMFRAFGELGVVGRAIAEGDIRLRCRSPRDFGVGKHRNVDDTPYGGGAGMVMRVDCLVACVESLDEDHAEPGHRVLLSPQGRRFDQGTARRLAGLDALTLVCGRYEGFDDRVRDHVHEELSLGDFVLSGGELAAMAIIDASARHLAGVLGNPASLREESHGDEGRLEYPQYTRPAEFRGTAVPDVLLSGNHAKIATWRRQQAEARTRLRRPDLLEESP